MIACKQTILVVEDSDTMWFLYSDLLGEDYVLRRAKDGREALHHVVRSKPDLIILDWTLDDIRPWDEEARDADAARPSPGLAGSKTVSGLDILRTVKRSTLRNIPVIMLTGHGGFHEKLLGKILRADKYLTKPLNETAFLKAVHSFVPPVPRPTAVSGRVQWP
jgi:chemotaxis family two-component system response regulator PixG